jgi:hypothetical protein
MPLLGLVIHGSSSSIRSMICEKWDRASSRSFMASKGANGVPVPAPE